MSGVNGVTLPMQYLESGQGERTDAGGTHYVNDALGINSETTSGQTTDYTRTPSGKLVSQRIGSTMYYYLFDGQGSVVALTDGSGNIAAQYRYDPWGQSVDKSGAAADGNPFRYTGGYLDRTGYYKLGQRYYDPAQGRFTQLDPLGTGYVYASDNPVNRVDPTGLDSCAPGNTCQGVGNEVSGVGNVVVGNYNFVYGDNDTVVGDQNFVYGDANTVVGRDNVVLAYNVHLGGNDARIAPPGAEINYTPRGPADSDHDILQIAGGTAEALLGIAQGVFGAANLEDGGALAIGSGYLTFRDGVYRIRTGHSAP